MGKVSLGKNSNCIDDVEITVNSKVEHKRKDDLFVVKVRVTMYEDEISEAHDFLYMLPHNEESIDDSSSFVPELPNSQNELDKTLVLTIKCHSRASNIGVGEINIKQVP